MCDLMPQASAVLQFCIAEEWWETVDNTCGVLIVLFMLLMSRHALH